MRKPSLFSTVYILYLLSVLVSYSQLVSAQTQVAAPVVSDCRGGLITVCNQSTIQIDLAATEGSCGARNIYWWSNDSDAVQGIFNAWLYQFCSDDSPITFWIDEKPNGQNWAMQSTEDGFLVIEGEINAAHSLCYGYEIKSSLPDGETVTIAERDFNPSAGRLFLISTKNGELHIKQLDHDLSGVSAYDIKIMAVRYPDINSFFKRRANNEEASSTIGILDAERGCESYSIFGSNHPSFIGDLSGQ